VAVRERAVRQPEPIIVAELFPEVLDALLVLLSDLSPEDWARPTACARWSVKDVALHLLGDEVGILSRKRDGFSPASGSVKDWDELVSLINHLNEIWVEAARRISPRLLCDLLEMVGAQSCAYLISVDPYAVGGAVSWAGPEPAPVWLDLAREYTERWLHQRHIRDAVGRPGLKEPRFFDPVLEAFVRALLHTFRTIHAPDGTLVMLTISGDAGGVWSLSRDQSAWNLYLGVGQGADAQVIMDQEVAWRLFTRGIRPDEALPKVTIMGDTSLGRKVLDTVAVIA
jgi:uncharacterized protein (TIGR03083 family)